MSEGQRHLLTPHHQPQPSPASRCPGFQRTILQKRQPHREPTHPLTHILTHILTHSPTHPLSHSPPHPHIPTHSLSLGLFGCGNYFADQPSKSDQYSVPRADGLFPLFLARVCLGTPEYTTDKDKRSAREHSQRRDGKLYDSLIGQTGPNKYREFVLYHGDQCYPEYLIWYRRER